MAGGDDDALKGSAPNRTKVVQIRSYNNVQYTPIDSGRERTRAEARCVLYVRESRMSFWGVEQGERSLRETELTMFCTVVWQRAAQISATSRYGTAASQAETEE